MITCPHTLGFRLLSDLNLPRFLLGTYSLLLAETFFFPFARDVQAFPHVRVSVFAVPSAGDLLSLNSENDYSLLLQFTVKVPRTPIGEVFLDG